MHRFKREYIMGVALDCCSAAEADGYIADALSGEGEGVRAVFTPNPEIMSSAASDSRLAELLCKGDLNVADGIGALWAARRMGADIPERIAGIDIGERAIEKCAERRMGVYLLGGREGVAERAGRCLADKYRGLRIAGVHNGYFERHGEQNGKIVSDINESGARLLIVCLGGGRQEEWIIKNRDSLRTVRVAMALGGALDVWSGDVKRAPDILRRAGLEWMWRTLRQPRRIFRLARLPLFVVSVLHRAHREGRGRGAKI